MLPSKVSASSCGLQQPVGDGGVVADEAARAAQQVALEVVGLDRVAVGIEPRVGGDAGGIEVPVDAGAQVERFVRVGAWRRFAVLDLVDQDVAVQRARVGVRGRAAHGLLHRAAQRVVGGGEVVAAAVPGADGLAGHVVQHPARAGLHAELVDAVAEHVVGVAHDDALLERTGRQVVDGQFALVAHGALVAFDVQLDAGGEALFGAVEVVAGADDAVARHGQEGAAERIEMRGGRRVGVGCGARWRPFCSCGPSAPPMRCACQVCQGWAGWRAAP